MRIVCKGELSQYVIYTPKLTIFIQTIYVGYRPDSHKGHVYDILTIIIADIAVKRPRVSCLMQEPTQNDPLNYKMTFGDTVWQLGCYEKFQHNCKWFRCSRNDLVNDVLDGGKLTRAHHLYHNNHRRLINNNIHNVPTA